MAARTRNGELVTVQLECLLNHLKAKAFRPATLSIAVRHNGDGLPLPAVQVGGRGAKAATSAAEANSTQPSM